MTISAQALATRGQAQYASGNHSGIADTFKLGTGGSAGLRPHELLEAALASCMIISARMKLAEQGLDDTGVGVAVEVEREEAVSRFRYTLILPPQGPSFGPAMKLSSDIESPVETFPMFILLSMLSREQDAPAGPSTCRPDRQKDSTTKPTCSL